MLSQTNTRTQGEGRSVFGVKVFNYLNKPLLHPCSYSLKVILDRTDRLIFPLSGTQWNDASFQVFRSQFLFPNISFFQTNRNTKLPWHFWCYCMLIVIRSNAEPEIKPHLQPKKTSNPQSTRIAQPAVTALQWLSQGYFNNPQHVSLILRAQQEMIGKWNEAAGYYVPQWCQPRPPHH